MLCGNAANYDTFDDIKKRSTHYAFFSAGKSQKRHTEVKSNRKLHGTFFFFKFSTFF